MNWKFEIEKMQKNVNFYSDLKHDIEYSQQHEEDQSTSEVV